VGNKSDLDRERCVLREEGENLASEHEVPFFETSAKNGTNVNEAFTALLKKSVRDVEYKVHIQQEYRKDVVNVNERPKGTHRYTCCS
jgi:GTPase SAR1 family protein